MSMNLWIARNIGIYSCIARNIVFNLLTLELPEALVLTLALLETLVSTLALLETLVLTLVLDFYLLFEHFTTYNYKIWYTSS